MFRMCFFQNFLSCSFWLVSNSFLLKDFLHKFSPWTVICVIGPGPLWTKHFSASLFPAKHLGRHLGFFAIEKALLGAPPWNQNAVLPVVGNWDEPPDNFWPWVFWSSGKPEMMDNMTWILPAFVSDVSAISLGNSENLFLCELHHRFSSPHLPKHLWTRCHGLNFSKETAGCLRHETTQQQRCKNHTYEERLMGSSRLNTNVGFLKV